VKASSDCGQTNDQRIRSSYIEGLP